MSTTQLYECLEDSLTCYTRFDFIYLNCTFNHTHSTSGLIGSAVFEYFVGAVAMRDRKPLVSICLPTLNADRFIKLRLDSIVNQTVTDWELIVCDSFSDDRTWEYLESFKGDPRVTLYQVPREGLYAGWNECLQRCRGEYVYIATADDTCEPDLLEQMVGALQAAQTIDHRRQATDVISRQSSPPRPIDICVSDYAVIDDAQRELHGHHEWRLPRKFYGDWMQTPHIRDGQTEFLIHACLGIVWFTITSVVFRRSLLDRIGYFRTDLGSQADEEWEMRAALASDIVYLPERLATWRVHENQATARVPRINRAKLACLRTVLDDPAAGVPDRWRTAPRWKADIMQPSRSDYQDALGLYRGMAKRSPRRFMEGVLTAVRDEPAFLLRQLASGFAWQSKFDLDKIAHLEALMNRLGASWPPQPF